MMKTLNKAVAIAMLMVGSQVAMADITNTIGIGYENASWDEYISGTKVVHEHGPRITFTDTLAYKLGRYDSWTSFKYFKSTSMTYDGQTMGGTPVSTDVDYNGFDLDTNIAYPVGVQSRVLAGLGVKSWSREIKNPAGTQKEDYTSWYVKAGMDYKFFPELTVSAVAKLPFYTTEDAHFGDFGAENNPALKPKATLGALLEAKYQLHDNMNIAAYYDYTKFNQSSDVTLDFGGGATATAYQPKSVEKLLGVRLDYRF